MNKKLFCKHYNLILHSEKLDGNGFYISKAETCLDCGKQRAYFMGFWDKWKRVVRYE